MVTGLMWRTLLAGVLTLGVSTCASAAANEKTDAERSLGKRPSHQTLVAGTLIQATTQDSLLSRVDKAGETLSALVSGDVKNANGQVVIPAGSRVALRIARLEPATNRNQTGQLALDVTSLTVLDQRYPVSIRLESTPHGLQGRGVTTSEMERVGGGTAILWANRDVVVPRGTQILFVLAQPLTVATR